jgi:hypothetical protein
LAPLAAASIAFGASATVKLVACWADDLPGVYAHAKHVAVIAEAANDQDVGLTAPQHATTRNP